MDQLTRDARKRLEFIRHFEKINDVTKTCKAYKISRPTFYKWYKRYQQMGNEGLEDQPKTPKTKTASQPSPRPASPAPAASQFQPQSEPEPVPQPDPVPEPEITNILPSQNGPDEAPDDNKSSTNLNIPRPTTSDSRQWQAQPEPEKPADPIESEALKQPESQSAPEEKHSIWDEPEKSVSSEPKSKPEPEPDHVKHVEKKSEKKNEDEESYLDLIVSDAKSAFKKIPGLIKFNKKTTTWLGIIIALIIASAPPIYFYNKYKEALNKTQNPEAAAKVEAEKLVKKVGELIELPADELPTVATVFDKEQLKNQPFFAQAKEGDKVLIYQNSGKAILYDPDKHIIVEVGVLNAAAQLTPAP